MEDLTYATREAIYSLDSDLAGAGPNLVLRVLTAVPAHWAYTALAAVGVLLLLPTFSGPPAWSYARRMGVALSLMAAASFMHFVWDAPAPDDRGWVFLLGKLAINLAVFLIPVALLLRFEHRWVADRMPPAAPTDTSRRYPMTFWIRCSPAGRDADCAATRAVLEDGARRRPCAGRKMMPWIPSSFARDGRLQQTVRGRLAVS
ncbi:PrsW family glutamic-type intramembrane protease [Mycobacterium sp. NPDC003323]